MEVDERVVLQQMSCKLYDDYPAKTGVTGEKVCAFSVSMCMFPNLYWYILCEISKQ